MNIRCARVPHNRSVLFHNRVLCPLAVLLATVLCCMVAVGDPWLETTIDLSPRTGVAGPNCLAYCDWDNTVWVAGTTVGPASGYVAVAIDGATLSPVAKAHVGADGVNALCYAAPENKLYATNSGWYGDGTTLTVIDCGTRQVLSYVEVGTGPLKMCYSSISNKLYCLTSVHPDLAVVDCASDTVLARLQTGTYVPSDLLWVPLQNQVYVANCGNGGNWDSTVTVVDCESDTIVATIPVGAGPSALCYNNVDGKVYCAVSGGDSTVKVIDCGTRQVIATVTVGKGPCALCYNSRENKVYCSSFGYGDTCIAVIDGAGDSVIRAFTLSHGVNSMCYDPRDDKLYCRGRRADRITVLDGAADTVIRVLPTGRHPIALCYDSIYNTVHCANESDPTVTVVDCQGDSILATVQVGPDNPTALCYNPRRNLVYSADGLGDVAVIDGATNGLLAQVPVGRAPTALCLNPQRDKLYGACYLSDNVYCMKASNGLVFKVIPVGNGPRVLCYDSIHDKIYCANDSSANVTVIDCASDSVVATVLVGDGPRALLFNAINRKVYCANERSSSITAIDCAADTVAATVAVEAGPSALSLNARRNKLYCACYEAVRIAVVDCAADTVVAIVSPPGSYPKNICDGICYGSVNDEVYFGYSTQSPSTVGVAAIECSQDSVVATTALSLFPRALLYDSTDNHLFVSMYSGWPSTGKAAIIDVGRRRAYPTTWLGTRTQSLAWNPSEARLYVANSGSGTISVIKVDSLGVADAPHGSVSQRSVAQTVVRGVLHVPASSVARGASCVLLDISGRKVMDLGSGANDVRALAPGVYFVTQQGSWGQGFEDSRVTKVVVTK